MVPLSVHQVTATMSNRVSCEFPTSAQLFPDIRKIVNQSGLRVRVVETSGRPLLSLLNKPPHQPQCKHRNCPMGGVRCYTRFCVYRLDCDLCGEFYIGSTYRPIAERIAEHRRAAINPSSYKRSAISHHTATAHKNSQMTFHTSIIHVCRDETNTRIAEGMYIRDLQPTLNRRFELSQMFLVHI